MVVVVKRSPVRVLARAHLPRVSSQSRLTTNDRDDDKLDNDDDDNEIIPGLWADILAFTYS